MKAKPCPFCGLHLDPNDVDILYPSGTAWKEEDFGDGIILRHYVRASEAPKENWCYNLVCQTHYGGCGASMSGDSKEETVEKWNKRSK